MRPFLLWLSDAYKMISFWGIDCSFCQMMWTLPTMLSYVRQSLMKIDSIVRMRFVHTHTCQIMLKISHKVNSERCFVCVFTFLYSKRHFYCKRYSILTIGGQEYAKILFKNEAWIETHLSNLELQWQTQIFK